MESTVESSEALSATNGESLADTTGKNDKLGSISSEIQKVFENITEYANECTSLISALCCKIENGDISTEKVACIASLRIKFL